MEAFQELYEKYHQDIYRFVLKMVHYRVDLAEELTQETFSRYICHFIDLRANRESRHGYARLLRMCAVSIIKKIRFEQSFEEIGRVMNLKTGTVKTVYYRGKEMLRKKWEEK